MIPGSSLAFGRTLFRSQLVIEAAAQPIRSAASRCRSRDQDDAYGGGLPRFLAPSDTDDARVFGQLGVHGKMATQGCRDNAAISTKMACIRGPPPGPDRVIPPKGNSQLLTRFILCEKLTGTGTPYQVVKSPWI